MKLLVHSAKQLVFVTHNENTALKGEQMNSITVLSDPEGVAVVVDTNGIIVDFGINSHINKQWENNSFEEIIDATDMCVLPGFVDAHTHPIWSGDRIEEFIMKLEGATYMDIHNKNGGIYSTVASTNKASEEELYETLKWRLTTMMQSGTTVAECKSGYGLTWKSEERLLKILQRVKEEIPLDISITHCGAHAVPQGLDHIQATKAIIEDQLPSLVRMIEKNEVDVENIDVFCEKGVFNVEDSRRILLAGKKMNLRLNFHGEELFPAGAAEMGAELNAMAISHLQEVSPEGIMAMSKAGTIAVMLPTTAFFMHLKVPPVRQFISEGVAVALGSDFNPNAYCLSMSLVMHLACIYFGMTITEALVASTLNAAASIGRSATNGSIQKGKWADFVLIKAPRWEHIIYQFGAHTSLIRAVVKKGVIVYRKDDTA